ncbi:MAG: FG-GAP repeat protein, partial [Phycisphaerae bacterium]|nr:FG-GAP repeat protein [Phycisphaerae bacterium]
MFSRPSRRAHVVHAASRAAALLGLAGAHAARTPQERRPATGAPLLNLFDALEPRKLLFASTVANPAELFLARLARTFERAGADEVAGFGRAVANLGDLNADGADDLAISAPGGGSALGLVDVYSGKTGARLWTVAGDAIGFGRSLARVADVTGDSIPDLAVGSPNSGSGGSVFIYSGANGTLFGQLIGSEHGAGPGANFGWSLDSGQADSDPSPDLAIGAPSDGPSYAGRVYLINASSAGTLRILNGAEPGQLFGWSVAFLANAEGAESLGVGSPGADTDASQDNGRIDQFSDTGATLFTAVGRDSNDMLGFALAPVEVASSAGVEHLAVGSPGADVWSLGSLIVPHAGIVQVFDRQGGLWALLAGEHPGGLFGSSIASIARSSGEYYNYPALIAIGSPGAPGGGLAAIHDAGYYFGTTVFEQAARIHTTRVHLLRSDADIGFGSSLVMGDFNGDGMIDAAITASLDGPQIHTDLNETSSGRVRLYSAVEDPGTTNIFEVSPDQSWCLLKPSWMIEPLLAGPDGFSKVSLNNFSQILSFIDLDNAGRLLLQRGITNQFGGTDYSTLLFHNGAFTEVSNNITQWLGAPGEWTYFDSVVPIALLPDGSAIVQRWANLGSPVIIADNTFWRVEGDTATFLWRGQYHNSSAAGVVGRRFVSYNESTGEFTWMTTLWTPSGGVVDIPALSNAGAIDDAGNIVGVDPATKTFTKRD